MRAVRRPTSGGIDRSPVMLALAPKLTFCVDRPTIGERTSDAALPFNPTPIALRRVQP